MDRFGIIQLSDLQFGAKHRFGVPSNIAKKLAADIQLLSERYVFTPTYLILSGDITERAHAKEFEDAIAQIESLTTELSIDRDSVLVVPGNHDVNWKLADLAEEVGDDHLKFSNYNKFLRALGREALEVQRELYPRIFDHRLKIEFLLLNSCEKESSTCHIGFVDIEKLLMAINPKPGTTSPAGYTKFCVLHHRLDSTIPEKTAEIGNSADVEAILMNNGYHIVLSGHVHQNAAHVVEKDKQRVIYSGTGSTGVDASQRTDGLQNQYCVHVVDTRQKHLETHWRAFNPARKTKYGLGGWGEDNSSAEPISTFELPHLDANVIARRPIAIDSRLLAKFNISENPFTFRNAEKIDSDLILDLFVSDEARHKAAMRLSGDAVIRGRKGSGKTMLLRYLRIYSELLFDKAVAEKRTAEVFPVFVNLSLIHRSEITSSVESAFTAADDLIHDSILDAIEEKAKALHSPSFRKAVHEMKQRLKVLDSQGLTKIAKLGTAIQENLKPFFSHILLLIDEIAPVFPREFFSNKEQGFLRWMNAIRNSGPYYTRVAVYPNDLSDILNEDRYGTIVNLEYEVRGEEDYGAFRNYCIRLVDRYLASVSADRKNPIKTEGVLLLSDVSSEDALEQLLYASDGSSRRFLSLMDRCLNHSGNMAEKPLLYKSDVFNVIRDFSSGLLSGYNKSEQELAQSIAKACKKQVTFRFRLPGLSVPLNALYGSREETNIVKIAELGKGPKGTTYEFTYPYCILMDIQTHNLKDTRTVCSSRDHLTGEWIAKVTTIEKDQLEVFNSQERISGTVTSIAPGCSLIRGENGKDYLSEDIPVDISEGDIVSFLAIDEIGYDLVHLGEDSCRT